MVGLRDTFRVNVLAFAMVSFRVIDSLMVK